MKRFGILSGLALAALAITNCTTKEIDSVDEAIAQKEGVPFEIIALAGDETRTTVDGMNTSWESTDEINLFHAVAGETTYINDGVFTIDDTETGQFTGQFTGTSSPVQNTAYDWYVLYPYDANLTTIAGENGTNQWYTLGSVLNGTQTQASVGSTAHLGGQPLYGIKKNAVYNGSAPIISMNQLTSVAAVTITNNTSAAIDVASISLTAPENIVGTYFVDILGENVVYTDCNSYVSPTANLEVTNGTIAQNGTGVFYIALKPFTAASGSEITLTVTTRAGDSQTKVFHLNKAYTFSAGKMKTVNMTFTTEPSNDYILVENLSDIGTGWYMIVNFDPANEDESYVLTNGHLTSGTQPVTMLKDISGLTISADAKTITSSATNIKWKFEAVGNNEFKIKSAAPNSEDYLLCKNANTGLIIATWNYTGLQNTWNVSVNDGTNKYFYLSTEDSASDTRYLQVYLSEPDWRTYKGANQAYNLIRLYKKGTLLPLSGIGFSTASYEFTLNDANYTAFTGQALTNPNNVSVTWSSSNTQLASVSNGTVTFVPNKTGTTTISATFAGNQSFRSETVSYTITVNPNSAGLGLPFNETFTGSTGTMGWSGGAASGTIKYDNEGWESEKAYGADDAAKFGTGSELGTATTPAISYSGNATLSFKAGAWNSNSESTTLKLSILPAGSGTIYSDANLTTSINSVTMVKGAWTTYTVYLKNLTAPFTVKFEGDKTSNSRFFLDDISIVAGIAQAADAFEATMPNTDNVQAAGGTKSINVSGNVAWTASATNGATINPASGSGAGTITVTIPENTSTTNTASYSVTVSTSANVSPNYYTFNITQDAAPTVQNTSTEANPYTVAEAISVANELSGETLADVYVKGIITAITTAYSEQYHNVTFDITDDGDSESAKFRIYRAQATSADDFVIGDAVEFKGTLINYNNTTPQLTQGNTLIAQLHKPTISPDGGTFTTSQSVSIAVNTSTLGATGAAIHYTTDGNDPTASSATYTSAFSISETTTVKAVATKGVLITGVTSATITKNSGKTNQVLFHETFGNNSGSARAWNDSYSVKSGVNAVYSAITGYTVTNAKQSKNTVGSVQSGLLQTTTGSDAVLIIGPLAVADAENMVLTYQWNAGSIKKTYSTKLYYATSSSGTYSEITGTGQGATSFVTRSYTLPAAAQVNTLYLKIVWNTSNTQAVIDEVNLQGDY